MCLPDATKYQLTCRSQPARFTLCRASGPGGRATLSSADTAETCSLAGMGAQARAKHGLRASTPYVHLPRAGASEQSTCWNATPDARDVRPAAATGTSKAGSTPTIVMESCSPAGASGALAQYVIRRCIVCVKPSIGQPSACSYCCATCCHCAVRLHSTLAGQAAEWPMRWSTTRRLVLRWVWDAREPKSHAAHYPSPVSQRHAFFDGAHSAHRFEPRHKELLVALTIFINCTSATGAGENVTEERSAASRRLR